MPPGQAIEIDASGTSGTCLSGALQYRFRKDGTPGAPIDNPVLLRDYSENAVYIDSPPDRCRQSRTTLVDVRCSQEQDLCGHARTVNVDGELPELG